MFECFTDRARKVMTLGNQEAQRFNHEYIGTEHILLGIVKEGSGVGANALKNLDIDLRKIRLEIEKLVKSKSKTGTMGRLPQTPRAKKVIELAIEEARNLNHNYVGTEHLLLGLLRETEGLACSVLQNLSVTLEEVRTEVKELLGKEVVGTETLTPFSFRFDRNKCSYELLDSDGRVVDSKTFGGVVGVYVFNALRKHESTQKLLRDLAELLDLQQMNQEVVKLLRRINRLLDS